MKEKRSLWLGGGDEMNSSVSFIEEEEESQPFSSLKENTIPLFGDGKINLSIFYRMSNLLKIKEGDKV